ncbi:C-GCAxxG-C-C family protein [uncultured Megasphaera sp.]|uniref:C-GCAxxG-C-C family protein n=1 Tax=uncultured Megasphaera sp. TaxID=165188 RepID=UPI0025E96CBF|nr:C-GCAxxG-C-C family protein [uncultured Megasphaera sp.]
MEDVKKLAAAYHEAGNNCAETVVKVCNDCLELNLPQETLRMVSVLGGGVAGSGCLCGALNGACLVLGSLVGRTEPDEKTKAEINQPVREFEKIWLDRFKATCCRVLKSPANGGPVACGTLMGDTAVMLIDFIRDKKLA